MQLALFDENNILKNTYQKKLADFDLTGAQKTLVALSAKWDRPKNIIAKINAITGLHTKLASKKYVSVQSLAKLAVRLPEIEYLRPLEKDLNYLRKGLMKEISSKLDDKSCNYIIPELHPAEVYIETMEFDEAVQAATCFLTHNEERACLRQALGFVYYKKGNYYLSIKNLSLALFHNPLHCCERFLPQDEFMPVLNDLEKDIDDSDYVWIRLPFELWKQNKIPITYDDTNYIDHITKLTSIGSSNDTKDAIENGLMFIRLLYLAETLRLQNADYSKMIDLRTRMKAIDPESFREYKEVIRKGV